MICVDMFGEGSVLIKRCFGYTEMYFLCNDYASKNRVFRKLKQKKIPEQKCIDSEGTQGCLL